MKFQLFICDFDEKSGGLVFSKPPLSYKSLVNGLFKPFVAHL
jgi:hypothetical protein